MTSITPQTQRSPKGLSLMPHGPGMFRVGSKVKVTRKCSLDREHHGKVGVVLGWTIPHGYALIQTDSDEVCLHPESLEVCE